MTENREKRKPLIPLMNEGLGELMCRRHVFIVAINVFVFWLFKSQALLQMMVQYSS